MKKKVLIFVEYYLPGYKSGGPLQSVKNIVKLFGEEVDFFIVSLDRDLGDVCPYDNVQVETWTSIGNAKIIYMPPSKMTLLNIKKIMQSNKFDMIYLNSFFSYRFTVIPIFVYRIFNFKSKLLVAPRGEFSRAALSLKLFKKRVFLNISKILKLYSRVSFHASSDSEMRDISRVMGDAVEIKIAKDLPDITVPKLGELVDARKTDALRVCFISRIVQMKNLEFAIDILMSVNKSVEFVIYGSKEDANYWEYCKELLNDLPPNIAWSYCGELHPEEVKLKFAENDIFLFPTRGENYGHVIAEALLSGTYILISDKTPWQNLESLGVGRVIPLSHKHFFVSEIESWCGMLPIERRRKKLTIQKNAIELVLDKQDISANRELFIDFSN